ncbi:MAG: amidohydrolase [Candidatus Ancillula sp.]|jgi:amidohydrolase|nr:amidohydrolase [Candidatus Ancillula sp.]
MCYNESISITGEMVLRGYDSHKEHITTFRRHIHEHPEVGWKENATTEFLLESFAKAGIEAKRLSPTGVVANVYPKGENMATPNDEVAFKALRGDIDALPIQESTGLDYASKTPGVSHACGHDFHTASIYGAALILNDLRAKLKHPVRFIFQPAEETRPSGAKELIDQGVLEDVQEIYAIHAEPRLEVGKIGIREGALTSAADICTVKVSGSGGHSSRPHLTADVIQALSAIVNGVPVAFSRIFDPRSVVSLTWGKIEAGDTPNAIPDHGFISGTLRTTDIDAWMRAEAIFKDTVESIAKPFGAKVDIIYEKGVPPVINTEVSAAKMRKVAYEYFGDKSIHDAERSLGGEDFSWYLMHEPKSGKKIQGAMARFGAATPGREPVDIHQPNLIVDEKLLDYSVPFLAGMVI